MTTAYECAHGSEPVELVGDCDACGGDRAGIGIGCSDIPRAGGGSWRHLCHPCFTELAQASYAPVSLRKDA